MAMPHLTITISIGSYRHYDAHELAIYSPRLMMNATRSMGDGALTFLSY